MKRDDLIFELIKKRLEDEMERTNNLDTKAGNLIGFISVVVGLLLGAGTFRLSALLHNHIVAIIYFLGAGLLLVSIGLALNAFRVRNWIVVPDVQVLIDKYRSSSYGDILRRCGGTMASAVITSQKQNNAKAVLIEWSWYLLISGLSTVFLFLIVYVLTGVDI